MISVKNPFLLFFSERFRSCLDQTVTTQATTTPVSDPSVLTNTPIVVSAIMQPIL